MKNVLAVLNALVAGQEDIQAMADQGKETCNVKVKGHGAFAMDFSLPSCDVIALAFEGIYGEGKEALAYDEEMDSYYFIFEEVTGTQSPFPITTGSYARGVLQYEDSNHDPAEMWGTTEYGAARWELINKMRDAVEERIKETSDI